MILREARQQERKEWIQQAFNQSPITTAIKFGKIFQCHPLTAVKREQELISKYNISFGSVTRS